jgi:Bifunctional DNA primase/polymerase, N-terminal
VITFALHPIVNGACGCGNPACTQAGKHPAERWRDLPAGRPELVPSADRGVGIATGASSGVFVVDLDVKNGIDGIDALSKLGDVPATYAVATPSGGFHLYYKHPGFPVRNSATKSNPIAPGVDVRGDGGYVVAPGSPHKNGGRYIVASALPVAEAPAWLLAWPGLRRTVGVSAVPAAEVEELLSDVPRAWRVGRAKKWLEKEPAAVSGHGGSGATMRAIAGAVRQFGLTDVDMVIDGIADWNARCVPSWEGSELAHKIDEALHRSNIPWNTSLRLEHALEARGGVAPADDGDGENAPEPAILIDTDLARVVDQGANALGRAVNLYQRGGELIRVVRVADTEADAVNVEGAPSIRSVPPSTLKAVLTSVAQWERKKEVKAKGAEPSWKTVSTTPGDDVVAAVSQRGEWSRVRPLTGIVEAPTMRPDGSILQTPGYDAATAYIFEPGGTAYPAVPDRPTQEDARRALSDLADVFADFPFANDAARATPIAAALTVVGRPAVEGNVPAFGIDAPTRGTGKTLLADAIGTIATGRRLSKITFPASAEELEKILAGYARRGASLFSWDNVTVPFGGGPLDKVLTCGDTVDLRILGRTEVPTFRWRAVQLFTGNGIELCGDTSRRVLMCRLESPLEDPENRADFKHPDLLRYIGDNRARLVVSALTVLRAYVVAGRPAVGVRPWGSFEQWSALVASAVAWSGGTDPQGARPADDATAEPEKADLAALLAAWPATANRLTAGELLTHTDGALHLVVNRIVPLDERGDRARKLSRIVSRWKGRVINGRRLSATADSVSKILRWRVEAV